MKNRLARNELLTGTMIFECFSPGIAQIVRAAGADFILYDMEHSGAGVETMKAQFAHCRGLPIAPWVRVPVNEYTWIARVLDAGAHGVMIPMVDSVDDAKRALRAMQYPPVGHRGSAFGMAHDDYLPGSPVDKIAAARAKKIPIVVDPKYRNFFAYKGATIFKPNRRELDAALGAALDLEHPEALPATFERF